MEGHKSALIIGINGQLGYYLKELLLSKGYRVHGLIRVSSTTKKCAHGTSESDEGVVYHYGDLADINALVSVIACVRPRELYNVGSMSNAQVSFDLAEYVQQVDGMGTLRLLEAVRLCSLTHFTRIYQAGSAELFGNTKVSPQNESTSFHPRSPYGVSKLYSYWTVVNHREAYGMHLSNGIGFNCESPRRRADFVSRKITSSVARIKRGLQNCLEIGNLDAQRDWSHVADFARGIWQMLQQEKGDDYVLSSGVSRSVREFVTVAFGVVGIVVQWSGLKGSVHEIGVDCANPRRVLVKVNPTFFRPCEKCELRGNSDKALRLLNWKPSISFGALVKEMVLADLSAIDCTELDCK